MYGVPLLIPPTPTLRPHRVQIAPTPCQLPSSPHTRRAPPRPPVPEETSAYSPGQSLGQTHKHGRERLEDLIHCARHPEDIPWCTVPRRHPDTRVSYVPGTLPLGHTCLLSNRVTSLPLSYGKIRVWEDGQKRAFQYNTATFRRPLQNCRDQSDNSLCSKVSEDCTAGLYRRTAARVHR